MKTNKIYKIIAIVMMLVISMFTLSCGLKEEKYDDHSNALMEEYKIINSMAGKYDESTKNKKDIEKMKKELNKFEEKTNLILDKMEKASKGNKELEKRTKIQRNLRNKMLRNIKKILTEDSKSAW